MAKEKNEKVWTVEDITPLDGALLADLDYERAVLSKAIANIRSNVKVLTKSAIKLDDHDAKQLICGVQVHNIKNGATAIQMYIEMAELLLVHMSDDLKTIHKRRKDFQRSYLFKLAQEEALRKEEEKRKADAERIAEKRSAEAPDQ